MISHNDIYTFELHKSFGTLKFNDIVVNGMQVHNGETTFTFHFYTCCTVQETLHCFFHYTKNAVLFSPMVRSIMDKPNHGVKSTSMFWSGVSILDPTMD